MLQVFYKWKLLHEETSRKRCETKKNGKNALATSMALAMVLAMTRQLWDPPERRKKVKNRSSDLVAPAMACGSTMLVKVALVATATVHGVRHEFRDLKFATETGLSFSHFFCIFSHYPYTLGLHPQHM